VNKKEAKKTLLIWARAGSNARAPGSESFLLLFYKKEALPYPPHTAPQQPGSSRTQNTLQHPSAR
jgi:hypothetical protein